MLYLIFYCFLANGSTKVIDASNLKLEEIHEHLLSIRNNSGQPQVFKEKTIYKAPAVRQAWNPWHETLLSPFDGSYQAWKESCRQLQVLRAHKRKELQAQSLAPYQ